MQMLTNVRLVLVNVIKIVRITLDPTHALVMLVLPSKVMDCIVMVIQLHGSMLLYSIVIGPWMYIDNDECDNNETNICEDLCINTNGSFYCGCSTPGYTLQSNGITCQSESCANTYYELHNFVTYICGAIYGNHTCNACRSISLYAYVLTLLCHGVRTGEY